MHVNLAVLCGTVTSDPTTRELASGSTVVQFDLATAIESGGRTERVSVPISWVDPPPSAGAGVEGGVDVVVVGRVRRRFFRVAGATQSRTEVVVERLVPARRTKSVRSVLAAATDEISRGCG